MLFELQQYLRAAAAQHREVVRSGPFLAHFDPRSDQPYANYAIPDADARPTGADVARLIELFAARGRQPALEFLPACAPAVRPALAEAGFETTAAIPLMTVEVARLVALGAAAGRDGRGARRGGRRRPRARAARGPERRLRPAAEEVDGEDLARLRDWAADGVVVHAREAGRVVGAARWRCRSARG